MQYDYLIVFMNCDRILFPQSLPPLDGQQVITELQRELLAIAAGASEDNNFKYEMTENWTELQGADYVGKRMNIFFQEEGLVVNL